jgi:hypothetical protein
LFFFVGAGHWTGLATASAFGSGKHIVVALTVPHKMNPNTCVGKLLGRTLWSGVFPIIDDFQYFRGMVVVFFVFVFRGRCHSCQFVNPVL